MRVYICRRYYTVPWEKKHRHERDQPKIMCISFKRPKTAYFDDSRGLACLARRATSSIRSDLFRLFCSTGLSGGSDMGDSKRREGADPCEDREDRRTTMSELIVSYNHKTSAHLMLPHTSSMLPKEYLDGATGRRQPSRCIASWSPEAAASTSASCSS